MLSPLAGLQVVVCCLVFIAATTSCRAEKPETFLSIVEQTFLANHDGTEQKYIVMTPPGLIPENAVSILITLHGHGSDRSQFVQQARGECRAARDVALAHKMLMVSPDYRAPTSWMGPAAEADLAQLIQILRKDHKVQRVILSGGSMGGTGALTFTALHPELIDGVVSLNGTANLVQYERFQDAITVSFGGTKHQVPAEYRKRSAEFYPKQFTMPFASTTGGQDDVVPAESVLRLISQIRKHNPKVLSIHRLEGKHSTTYLDTKHALEFVIQAAKKNTKL